MKLSVAIFSLALVPQAACFTPVHHVRKWSTNTQLNAMNDKDRFEREIQDKAEINARIKAMNKNTTGSTAAGAILGGLIFGPFGALFGASIGSNMGSQNNLEKARKEEMESMGISQEMLDQAREIGILLDRGIESLKLIEDALKTQQNFAKRLESDMDRIYADARLALQDGDEDKARDLLLKKTNLEEKLKKTLMGCVDEKKRLIGSVTDGDIRRNILKKRKSLSEKIHKFCNKKTKFILEGRINQKRIKHFLLDKRIEILPIIDKDRKITLLKFRSEILSKKQKKLRQI